MILPNSKILVLVFSETDVCKRGLSQSVVFCYVATVNGTTGEGLSLSIQERKLLAEEWMCQGKDK